MLAALVLIPFVLTWGTFLLIPAALLVVPCVFLAAVVATPALLVWLARTNDPGAALPEASIPSKPVFSSLARGGSSPARSPCWLPHARRAR